MGLFVFRPFKKTKSTNNMFVTKPRIFLAYVFENRFAVPSFNVSNLEMARAVIEAAELEDAPVMVQTYFINFNYGGMDELSGLIRTLAEKAPVPVLIHQDHPGKDSNIFRSLRRGYYSVMYDGGHLPLAENIAGATRFTEVAHESGAILESEIGLFGGEYQGDRPSQLRRMTRQRWYRRAEPTPWRFRWDQYTARRHA